MIRLDRCFEACDRFIARVLWMLRSE